MIKANIVRVFLAAASVITDETMARVLLDVARSPLNDSGEMYRLWCDDCGACKGIDNIENNIMVA